MQKRYCSCGQELFVHYMTKAGWTPKYWCILSLKQGETVKMCPHCGAPLDINALD